MGLARVDLHLAGEHDLLERPGADALHRPGDRVLVVLGRHRAHDAHADSGVGVQERERLRAQLAQALLEAGEQLGRVVAGQ